MDTSTSPVLLRITLTYEELALVLKLIHADTLPGLRPPQSEPLTPEQEVQALLFAERSLRARELARLTPDNHLVIHAALLSAVAVCAAPEQALVARHIRSNGEVVELYGSVKEEVVIAHTLPEPGLHQLAVLQDISALATQALTAFDCQNLRPAHSPSLAATDEALRRAHKLARQGLLREATAQLAGTPDNPAAAALVEALSQPHAVSIFLFLRRQADGALVQHELTVLHTAEAAWLLTELRGEDELRRVAPVATPELFAALAAELEAVSSVAAGS